MLDLSGIAGAGRHSGVAARSSVDLLHLLFGSILAVDRDAALFVSGVASLTLLCIALCYRGLVSEAFDSAWLQVNPPPPSRAAAWTVSGAAGA